MINKREERTMKKKITDEQFDQALKTVIDLENEKASNLLSIPGIYEILSEHYNNEAIDFIESNQ